MPVAQAPTTLNSMTHYALTEGQEAVLDDESGDELRKALRETASEEVKNRFQAAIDAGLRPDNALPQPGEQPPPEGGGGEEQEPSGQWVICDGGDPPKYWQDGSQEWVDGVADASHYNDDAKDAEQLPEGGQWVDAEDAEMG